MGRNRGGEGGETSDSVGSVAVIRCEGWLGGGGLVKNIFWQKSFRFWFLNMLRICLPGFYLRKLYRLQPSKGEACRCSSSSRHYVREGVALDCWSCRRRNVSGSARC